MGGYDAICAELPREKQLANVDVDAHKGPADVAFDIDLRVGRRFRPAGEPVGQGHDLGEPHCGHYRDLAARRTSPDESGLKIRCVPANPGADRRSEGGFAPTFKEAVGRWRRRHRHPPPNETW